MVVREWLAMALLNLWLVGRNGKNHYNNQDYSMMTGILVARNIATGAHFDPWLVNTDAEYHEEERADEAGGAGGAAAGRQGPERGGRLTKSTMGGAWPSRGAPRESSTPVKPRSPPRSPAPEPTPR